MMRKRQLPIKEEAEVAPYGFHCEWRVASVRRNAQIYGRERGVFLFSKMHQLHFRMFDHEANAFKIFYQFVVGVTKFGNIVLRVFG